MFERLKNLKPVEEIALSFFMIIMIGTFLLMLPFASRTNTITPFLDCLFTSTSACCVTGLVVVDTSTHWSIFGQIVILILIQIGGLGFITIGLFITSIFSKRLSLHQRGLLEESINTMSITGLKKLVKHIVIGTALFEGMGAVILSTQFIEQYGMIKGIYFGIFHSISAFCNAGFDLLGFIEPYGSLVHYSSNWIVLITIMLLILIGGLGFIVWEDLYKNKMNYKKWTLQTKIVVLISIILVFGGAVVIFISMSDMPIGDKIINALFQSVTCRTAGFNSIDLATLGMGGKLMMMLLMFIGGCPGSTAGGIKATTFVVIVLLLFSSIRGKDTVDIFNRRFDDDIIKKACTVAFINLSLIILGTIMISLMQPMIALDDLLMEIFSAMGTVGISTGITRDLSSMSRVIVILLMYFGRIGTLTFALSFSKKKASKIKNPAGEIAIG